MPNSFLVSLMAEIVYDGRLSVTAYVILSLMILLLVGGFSWCFYRAIRASNSEEEQLPDEE